MAHSFAQVVFNIPVDRAFDYAIPPALRGRIQPGLRLLVPFRNETAIGYCVGLSEEPAVPRVKEVIKVLDEEPLIDEDIFAVTRWMADYYVCGWGEALEAALPAGVREARSARKVRVARLAVSPEEASGRVDELEKKAPAQCRALATLLDLGGESLAAELAKEAGVSAGVVNSLAQKGLIGIEETQALGYEYKGPRERPTFELTQEQKKALALVKEKIDKETGGVVLLYGVTGSGKTEVYIRAIEEVVRRGKEAIVLVPEISLTPQTIARFGARFSKLAVLHSHLTPGQRHRQWRQIRRGEAQVVIGARSAVFAPTRRLGLIVIDEEHENTFKQEKAPRYNAREVALSRAKVCQVPVILGSATPSLESYARAKAGEFSLAVLPGRVEGRPLPQVEIVDMTTETGARRGFHSLSRRLEQLIADRLKKGEQVILFLNRRGFATYISCRRCGWVLRCSKCDISMVYHKAREKVLCHYCNRTLPAPQECPECGYSGIHYYGLGTEKVEEEVKALHPQARVRRMDSDAMRRQASYEEALGAFQRGETEILVGTQMIAKGLHFPNVTLVGVVGADVSLNLPDFRASERTFELLAQVAGRTGRGPKGGLVVVQTFSPEHYSVASASKHNFAGFAEQELQFRRQLDYPPYSHLIRVLFQGRKDFEVKQRAEEAVVWLKRTASKVDAEVLGPALSPIAQLRGRFRYHIIIKAKDDASLSKLTRTLGAMKRFQGGVQMVIDVDPYSML
ncbi:MAG: hypothetical protein AMS15_05065 [Planctomycetes bacterium DG_23]|nr:MAG: hypothetical protein AMS15_05065 [Planctomycetes bacterium DG_23]